MLSLAATAPLAFRAPLSAINMQQAAAATPTPEAPPPFNPVTFAKSLPGITDPLGFFDPAGFCTEATEEKIRFYREVEVTESVKALAVTAQVSRYCNSSCLILAVKCRLLNLAVPVHLRVF